LERVAAMGAKRLVRKIGSRFPDNRQQGVQPRPAFREFRKERIVKLAAAFIAYSRMTKQ
jgi:hypothetical protein